MGNKDFVVSYAVGDDRSFTINMSPERIAKGGDMMCQANGCTRLVPVKEGTGTCPCGARFEIYSALLNQEEEEEV